MGWHLSGYYVTTAEAAEETGLSERRIRQACDQQEIADVVPLMSGSRGNVWLIPQMELYRWRQNIRPRGRPAKPRPPGE